MHGSLHRHDPSSTSCNLGKSRLSSPLMRKRYASVLFLCIASLVMMGHSVLPHHHHHTIHGESVTHHSHDHGHGDLPDHHGADHDHEGGAGHPISHADHSEYPYTLSSGQKVFEALSWEASVALQPQSLLIAALDSEHLQVKPLFKSLPTHESPHALASGLRAPPIFIA
jgi:hypothetical protein